MDVEYSCAKCSMESGITSRLEKDAKTGELVCSQNQKHRFRLDASGFLESTGKK